MLTFEEAIALLEKAVVPLGSETAGLDQAAGRYLAADVEARIQAPRSDVSMMDGYAVMLETTRPGLSLAVVGEARPGLPFERTVAEGEAVRIFTGASVPEGADCVIMQEYASRDGDGVTFADGFGPAKHVRTAGSDFHKGDILLASGKRLDPRGLVAAAAADVAEVQVARQPRVAIIATGDELVPAGDAHRSATALPESASLGVAAMCELAGGTVVSRRHGRDRLADLTRLADESLAAADVVVVIGGASVGDYDLAKPMFGGAGLDIVFSRIAIKPGKPVWLGKVGGKPVLGLPGNPSSALVTARLFLRPLLARMQGGPIAEELRFVPLALAGNLAKTDSRETFVRASSTANGLLPASNQQSGAQAPLATSDWLIKRPAGSAAVKAGTLVHALTF